MEKLSQIFKIKDIRNKLFAIFGLLVIFRILAAIPIPGVDLDKIREFFSNNEFFAMLNVFSGGGMSRFSLVMLGVGPYITASIVMQLLTMIVPQVEKMYKEEGEAGRQKFNQITRFLTVPFAFLQGYAMVALLQRQGIVMTMDFWQTLSIIFTITAGTVLLMWIGELITKQGLGNGVSLIIFAGIVADLPFTAKQLMLTWDDSKLLSYAMLLAAVVAVIYVIVFITEGQRNIPVSYARRMSGSGTVGGSQAFLPLRVNQAGVIPIIFAMSVMMFPNMLANLLFSANTAGLQKFAVFVAGLFGNQFIYSIIYFLLVVAFTVFYTKIVFEPKSIAENLQKNGGFVPGIRPGQKTEDYLNSVLNRITIFGAVFLASIAVLPYLVQWFTKIGTINVGGTSLLIVISVVIETIKQIESQIVMSRYERI